jgi:hypothetical protein
MKNQYGVLKKSNKAIEAEGRGLVVYSKLKAWQKRAVDVGAVTPSAWHHTSGAANRTNFYELSDFEHLDEKQFKTRKTVVNEQPDLNRIKIKITFDKMTGGFTSRRKTFTEITVEGLDVRKKDNAIMGAEGRRLDSKNKEVVFLYMKPHSRFFKEVSKDYLQEIGYIFI